MYHKNITLYNETPNFNKNETIKHVSQICSTKHAPDDLKTNNVEEFLKHAKQYFELDITTRIKNGNSIQPIYYRCLFSDHKQAIKQQELISNQWNKQQQDIINKLYQNNVKQYMESDNEK